MWGPDSGFAAVAVAAAFGRRRDYCLSSGAETVAASEVVAWSGRRDWYCLPWPTERQHTHTAGGRNLGLVESSSAGED